MPNLFKLILQICVILVTARVVGMLFKKIRQPQVVGEMVAGILLGPSLLGWVAPQLSSALFPASSLGYLGALSQVGLVLFMFLVGGTSRARPCSGVDQSREQNMRAYLAATTR